MTSWLAKKIQSHPVCVLECPHEQADELVDGARLSEGGVVSGTKGQVADQANDSLDQRPPWWWVQQLDDHLQAVVEAHGVLCHLGLNVARGQVAQSANSWLGDLFAIAGVDDGAHERIHATHLAHDNLVALVVARQVGEDAGGARHEVDVGRAEQVHQALQETLESLLPWHIQINSLN